MTAEMIAVQRQIRLLTVAHNNCVDALVRELDALKAQVEALRAQVAELERALAEAKAPQAAA